MNFVLLIVPLNIVNLFGDDVLHSVISFRFFLKKYCFLLCMDKFISVNCDCLVVVIVIIFFSKPQR